jgi:hypothetical protein
MEGPYWKTIGRVALLVSLTAGLVIIKVHSDKVPPMYLYSLASIAIAFGVVGLLLDFKPWRWRLFRPSGNPEPAAASTTEEDAVLLGSWSVTKNNNIMRWTFQPGGMAIRMGRGNTRRGRWESESDCVRIVWNDRIPGTRRKKWVTFRRPIKADGVSGDAWDGENSIRAVKLVEAVPGQSPSG